MTSKLTREQLHERARENVKALKMASRQTAFESAREEILADLQLAELALAAMDSEPVGEFYEDGPLNWYQISDGDRVPAHRRIPLYRHAQPAPVVTFYRDGIEAAAKWIDQQREAYDSEHGWSDPDTGSFEFGSEIKREYSSTLEELAEGIRALHPNAGNSPVIPCAEQRIADAVELLKQAAPAMLADNGGPNGPLVGRLKSPAIPDGYVMVPKEPTQAMCAAFNDSDYGRKSLRERYVAMLAAAPQEVKP
ncbi:rRNA adenine N-6-methyltransferase family protein [Raoultella ornithinolytica]|uniref:rRNA adenine N-6-methyltransferase family protein n=1 Tax=Raoultella ornithinolytica TaxID=54291 RepID=UPI001F0FEB50|nr:rRNA adenine N-6-methyltransferase family protein [Raoultella ornithinolytica]